MTKKISILLSAIALSIFLSGCFPAVVIGAGTATGAALGRDSRSLQTISDDVDIEFQANQKLQSDSLTAHGTHITVTSFNHVVLLTGEVPSDAVRVRAEQDIQSVAKVRRVYNLLQVAPLEGIIHMTDDSRIQTNIKARMTFTSNLNSNDFKVVVENKVVYLMGYATNEQTQLALDVVRNSSGVARVVNLVEEMQAPAENTKPTVSTPTTNTASTAETTSTAQPTSDHAVATPVPEPAPIQPVH